MAISSTLPPPKSLFGGNHLGCKWPLPEPHFDYFCPSSTAMGAKMSLMRTPNQPFSPPKHHLQTSSEGIGLGWCKQKYELNSFRQDELDSFGKYELDTLGT